MVVLFHPHSSTYTLQTYLLLTNTYQLITYADDITITATQNNIQTTKHTYINIYIPSTKSNNSNSDKTTCTLYTPDLAEYNTQPVAQQQYIIHPHTSKNIGSHLQS